MEQSSRTSLVGLDVHKDSIAVAYASTLTLMFSGGKQTSKTIPFMKS